ncbi:MAG: hypothetical protein ACREFE_19000 [Limisphaerales bacterium]
MNPVFVIANGRPVAAQLPCSLEEFLVVQKSVAAQRRLTHTNICDRLCQRYE